jgi:16S rRNA (cytosine967-C5)-methyltransferase
MIVAEAAEYLRPGGRMVYATCSIFERENEKQLENFPLEVEKVLRLDPKSGGHDGFFAAVLRKKL